MSKKMGRPKLPKGESKDFQIGVRFTSGESVKIKRAISKTGLSNADWARNILLSAAGGDKV
jgi:predicted DNA binding CopG/RHH family protein